LRGVGVLLLFLVARFWLRLFSGRLYDDGTANCLKSVTSLDLSYSAVFFVAHLVFFLSGADGAGFVGLSVVGGLVSCGRLIGWKPCPLSIFSIGSGFSTGADDCYGYRSE
jgi:hypothetical protein